MSGPEDCIVHVWNKVGKVLQMEEPKPLDHYLGCNYKISTREVPHVGEVTICESTMDNYFKAICDDYVALARDLLKDNNFKLKYAPTPFLREDQKNAQARRPFVGIGQHPSFPCPYCQIQIAECPKIRQKQIEFAKKPIQSDPGEE